MRPLPAPHPSAKPHKQPLHACQLLTRFSRVGPRPAAVAVCPRGAPGGGVRQRGGGGGALGQAARAVGRRQRQHTVRRHGEEGGGTGGWAATAREWQQPRVLTAHAPALPLLRPHPRTPACTTTTTTHTHTSGETPGRRLPDHPPSGCSRGPPPACRPRRRRWRCWWPSAAPAGRAGAAGGCQRGPAAPWPAGGRRSWVAWGARWAPRGPDPPCTRCCPHQPGTAPPCSEIIQRRQRRRKQRR